MFPILYSLYSLNFDLTLAIGPIVPWFDSNFLVKGW